MLTYAGVLGKLVEPSGKFWKMVPACISWCIRIERSRRCFDGIATPNHILKAKCLNLLYSWSDLSPDNFLDFVSSFFLYGTHCKEANTLTFDLTPLCTICIFLMPLRKSISSSKKKVCIFISRILMHLHMNIKTSTLE